jgi:hypothetical protein
MWPGFRSAKIGPISSRAKEIWIGRSLIPRWPEPRRPKGRALRIKTQDAKPEWVTAAVQQAGGLFFNFDDDGVPTSIPVFWDPTFLAKKKVMITALGGHFTNSPAVKIVSASFANATSEDWNVPHTDVDVLNWFAVGYTTEKLLDAGKQIIDTTMSAFPNQFVTLAIAGNGHVGGTGNLDPTATYVAENAIAAARATWPGRLIVQINSLSTFNPAAPGSDDSLGISSGTASPMSQRRWSIGVMTNLPIGLTAECLAIPRPSLPPRWMWPSAMASIISRFIKRMS